MITQPVAALNRPQPSSSKSLTPQRKHRKLLKDGSGTEVWPEAIEKVFVQGLKEYWRSPFATYSRGRSRYRNQFLVEHLARAGITRTKKQVASHIQVLRNMWKGEPAFHLVAGGEELSTDSAIPNAHFDDHPFYDFGDCDSNSTSDYSPPEIKNEFPSPPSLAAQFTPDSVASSTSLPSLHASPESMHARLDPQHQPYSSHIGVDSQSFANPRLPIYHQSSPPPASSNCVLSFHLDADGMSPFIVNIDAHSPFVGASRPATAMKTKLYLPAFNSHSNGGGPRGFRGAISLASTFATGTCTTQVFHDQNVIHRETASFYPSLDQNGLVTAFLPDGPLSCCRDYVALASGVTTTLTQEIVVDNYTVLYAVHVLIGGEGGPSPTARFVGCRPQQTNSVHDDIRSPSGSPQQRPAVYAATHQHTASSSSYSVPSTSLYSAGTAPVPLTLSYSPELSPAYSLSSHNTLDSHSYAPSLSTSTGANLAYTYSGTSALSNSYVSPSSMYDSPYGSLSEPSVIPPSTYRRTSLPHGMAGPPIY